VILETLRSIPVPDAHHDLSRVLAIISRLGEDTGISRLFSLLLFPSYTHSGKQQAAGKLLHLVLMLIGSCFQMERLKERQSGADG